MRSPKTNVKCLLVSFLSLGLMMILNVGCEKSNAPNIIIEPETPSDVFPADLSAPEMPNFNGGDFDWPQYRGPKADSTQNSEYLPTQWSDTEGLKWKAELPGRGSSSPIVVGDRVFVTAFSGYGMSPTERGQVGHMRQHVICKDRETGETLWQRNIKGSMLTQKLNDTVLGHGFASSTPVSDGELVYAFFGPTGVFAFDMDGNLVWEQNVGWQFNFFGSSASLTMHKDLLIVNASIENKTIYALDKKTGKGIWKADNIDRCYSLPVFGEAPDGSTEMIVVEEDEVYGFNPNTGEKLWWCQGIPNYIIAVPVVHEGIVYCNGGLERLMMGIKLGGRGDVTQTHKVWEVPFGSNVGSFVRSGDLLLVVVDNGIAESYDINTGKLLGKQRTKTKVKRVYASPLMVGDKVYLPLQDEGVVVAEANEKMKELYRNKFKNDKSLIHGSIAANGDRLFIRTDRFLYCIGENNGIPVTLKTEETNYSKDLVMPQPIVGFDSHKNRLSPFCYYLSHDPAATVNILLAPYKSVITEEQTKAATEIIKKEENYAPYDKLRARLNQAYWEFMTGDIDRPKLVEKFKEIGAETAKQSHDVRILVKKLFSPVQMEQHKKDAAEWQKKQREKSNANQENRESDTN
jgi:outer membrane protein assembly factor BamB